MDHQPRAERVVHAFDVVQHRIVCGVAGQSSSTKHLSGVNCPRCRALLAERASAAAAAAASAVHS